MLESEMEELIARFPEEFFRGRGLVLKGRQQSFSGVGRFDLLFSDPYETNVLMELKARVAQYPDATQVAKYKEAMEDKGEKNILVWLVAPQVPNAVREFLDRIGIEYSEIHEAQFRRVAERHSLPFGKQDTPQTLATDTQVTRSARSLPRAVREFDDSEYGLRMSFDKSELEQLLKRFESVVRRRIDKSLALNLRKDLLEGDTPFMSRGTMQQLARWCNTNNPVYWDGMAIARKISEMLFGRILDRTRLGT